MPSYLFVLRREVVEFAMIDVEAADADAALEIVNDQIELQHDDGWPDKQQRVRARLKRWVAKHGPLPEIYPQPPDEEDLTDVSWIIDEHTVVITAVHEVSPEGKALHSMRPEAWFDWVRQRVNDTTELNNLVASQLHERKGDGQ